MRKFFFYRRGEDGKLYPEGYKVKHWASRFNEESGYFFTQDNDHFDPSKAFDSIDGSESDFLVMKNAFDERYYLVNGKREIVCGGFFYIGSFAENGLAVVGKVDDDKYYLINKKFETVSDGFDVIYDFESNGLAKAGNYIQPYDGKTKIWYYIDSNGKTITDGYYKLGDFASNGLAVVRKTDCNEYYINEKFETVSEGYIWACPFGSNGLAVVKKEDGLCYYINEKCETVSEGYKDATDFNEEGLARVRKTNGKMYLINENLETVGSVDSKGNRKSEEEFIFDLYLDGEIEVYSLPDECFTWEYLDKLIKNEKKVYEYLINMASTEEQMKKVQSDYESRADYIKGRAYEKDREKNKEKYENQTKEDILALKKKEYVGKGMF